MWNYLATPIKRVTLTHLRWINDFFTNIGIKYFVVEGPCLSIIRGGDTRSMTLPDNQDLDVYILKEDEPRDLVDKMVDAGWTNCFGGTVFNERLYDRFKFYAWRTDGLDMCALDLRFLFRYQNYRWSIILNKYCIYDDYLFHNARMVEVQGVTVSVPDPPEEYLRQEYGDDWMTPKNMHFYEYPCIHRAIDIGFHSMLPKEDRYAYFNPSLL